MTEADWLACADPNLMLSTLLRVWRRPSSRKLRLFTCACCRHVPALIDAEYSLLVVETVERYADGLATREELSPVLTRAWAIRGPHARTLSKITPTHVEEVRSEAASMAHDGIAERSYQAAILRDVFGLRRHPLVPSAIDPAWRTSDALLLARGIYEERAFDRMPILADALQDAGCDNEDILSHCRDATQPHVRGCWAVDLVLGKQ
jgi:hypothetical protein